MTERAEVRYWVERARAMREITGMLEWSELGRTDDGERKVDAARDTWLTMREMVGVRFADRRPVARGGQ